MTENNKTPMEKVTEPVLREKTTHEHDSDQNDE